MKKKLLLSVLVLLMCFVLVGCESKKENKESNGTLIKITDEEKGYETSFKSINDKLVQKNPTYRQVDADDSSYFISFQYTESDKATYDYYKTHNIFNVEYSEGDIKEYTFGNYSGYTYNINEKDLSFKILLLDDENNSVILMGYLGTRNVGDKTATDIFESEEVQNFLKSMEFKKL